VNEDKDLGQTEKPTEELTQSTEKDVGEGEFKITVRKLEMPVRPRGVLAE
jgi:hypothetical protein